MLTSKQRAYLRSLANSETPILHAGKGGVSDTMRRQADDALTARELIKGRALENSPVSAREVAEDLAASVGADVCRWWAAISCCTGRTPRNPRSAFPARVRRCPVKGGRNRTIPLPHE